jgi:hypothetical protein
MSRVSFEVSPNAKVELEARAESLGLSLAAYARNLVLERSRLDPQVLRHAELAKSIRALVIVFADALGRSQRLPQDVLLGWVQSALNRFENERGKP